MSAAGLRKYTTVYETTPDSRNGFLYGDDHAQPTGSNLAPRIVGSYGGFNLGNSRWTLAITGALPARFGKRFALFPTVNDPQGRWSYGFLT